MTNKEIFDLLHSELHASFYRLFYIAADTAHDDICDFIDEEMDEDEWRELWPDIHASPKFEQYYNNGAEGILNALGDFNKYGFIAEVLFNDMKGINPDKNGNPTDFTYTQSHGLLQKFYGETIEELIEKIKVKREELKETEIYNFRLGQV